MRPSLPRIPTAQSGFIIWQILATLAIAAIIIPTIAEWRVNVELDRVSDADARNIHRIETAQIRCFTDESLGVQQGWQINWASLRDHGCVNSYIQLRTSGQGQFGFHLNTDGSLTITADYKTKRLRDRVMRKLPVGITTAQTVNPTTWRVNYLLQNPYEDELHDDFMLVDGSRSMRGNLNMGGHNINNSNAVNSNWARFNKDITVGGIISSEHPTKPFVRDE